MDLSRHLSARILALGWFGAQHTAACTHVGEMTDIPIEIELIAIHILVYVYPRSENMSWC